MISIVPFLIYSSTLQIFFGSYRGIHEHYFNSSSKIELYDYFKKNTQPGDIILIDPKLDKKLRGLERHVNRPTLNIFKFIPSLRWFG